MQKELRWLIDYMIDVVLKKLIERLENIKNAGEDKMSKEKWMSDAVKPENKGKLRKKLGVKAGENIPAKKLEKATKSKNPTLRKEAVLAETFKKLRKK